MGGMGSPALAQSAGNADYQTFFGNTVCNMPSGLFLDRCGETFDPSKPDGDPDQYANISGDSESSLNPSQTSVAASNALAKAQALAAETEKRLEGLRDEDNGKPGAGSDKIAGFGPWSVFANFQGEWFDQSRPAYSNERGYDGDRYGGTIGADYRIGTTSHVGLMLAYEKYSMTFDQELPGVNFVPQDNAGGTKSKTFTATVFASFSLSDSAWLDASAGLGWSDNDFRRNAVFQPSTRTLSREVRAAGSADGKQAFASIGVGYDYADGPLSIGPYVRGRYTHSEVDAYSETDLNNTGLAMNVGKQKATSLAGILGVRSSYAIGASWGVVVPQIRLEYEHEFEDDPRTTLTSFVLDPNNLQFPIVNDAPDRNYFNAGIGLLFVLPNGVMPYIDYEALLGYSNFDRHRVTAGIRFEL